jgi:hypothetical protein
MGWRGVLLGWAGLGWTYLMGTPMSHSQTRIFLSSDVVTIFLPSSQNRMELTACRWWLYLRAKRASEAGARSGRAKRASEASRKGELVGDALVQPSACCATERVLRPD